MADAYEPSEQEDELRLCGACGGHGYMKCPTCGGQDDLGCDDCQGDLTVDCEPCEGTGYLDTIHDGPTSCEDLCLDQCIGACGV